MLSPGMWTTHLTKHKGMFVGLEALCSTAFLPPLVSTSITPHKGSKEGVGVLQGGRVGCSHSSYMATYSLEQDRWRGLAGCGEERQNQVLL